VIDFLKISALNAQKNALFRRVHHALPKHNIKGLAFYANFRLGKKFFRPIPAY
jgi:hypothetical protein